MGVGNRHRCSSPSLRHARYSRYNREGLLYPRLTTAQRNAINNPAPGLTIFNTTSQCFEAYFANGLESHGMRLQQFPRSQLFYSRIYLCEPSRKLFGNHRGSYLCLDIPLRYSGEFQPSKSPSYLGQYRNLYGKIGGYRQSGLRGQLYAVGYRYQLPPTRLTNL